MTREEAINLLADMDSDKYTAREAVALTMAIKALESPPNDHWEGYSKRLWKAAYERGKADAEQAKWIPVSERLPELYTFVYATCHSLVDDREDWVIETCYVPIPKEYNSRRFSDWGNIPMLNHGEAEVIAWMKRDIPEPYKVESEEEDE